MMLRRFSRGTALALEIVGLLVIILLAAFLALMLRLQQGPLQIDFLTARFEKAFTAHQNGFAFAIEGTQLIWGGPSDPFVLEMQDVRITRSDETPVAVVNRARVVLSKRNLLVGRIVPREFYLSSPIVRVLRNLDGTLSLNVGSGDVAANPAAIENAWDQTVDTSADPDPAAQKQFMAGLIRHMEAVSGQGLLGGLQRIVIDNATLAYDDRLLDVFWRADHAKIVIARTDRGVIADTVFQGDFAPVAESATTVAVPPAVMRLRVTHLHGSQETGVAFFFSGLIPAQVARQSAKLAHLAEVNVPLKGQVAVTLDDAMRPQEMAFVIGGGGGQINAAGLYPQPLDIKGLALSGRYNIVQHTGELSEIKLDLGGPELSGTAALITDTDGLQKLTIAGELTAMPLDRLGDYWSAKLAPDAQSWVTTQLSTGIADRATIAATLVYGQDDVVSIDSLTGQIDFRDITVDYFSPLEKVTGVTGTAVYDADSFGLNITGGALADMKVTKGVIDITNLGAAKSPGEHALIDIAVSLTGPLKTALAVIDSEPLRYPSQLGLDSKAVEGRTAVDVTFAFPLHKALDITEVAVTAQAQVDDVRLPAVALGMDLTGGPYAVALADGQLSIKGEGRLGDSGINLDWQKNFTKEDQPDMQLTAQITAPAVSLPAFGVPDGLKASGFLPAKVVMTTQQDGHASLTLDADLTPLGFTIPVVNVGKAEGEAGTLGLHLDMMNDRPVSIRNLVAETPGLSVAGQLDFAATGDTAITKAVLNRLKFGQTDVSAVTVDFPLSDGAGYTLALRGQQFDASAFFAEDDTPNSDEVAAKKVPPLSLDLNVARLITGKDKVLENVTLSLARNDYARIERLELDALAGGKPLMARYQPADTVGKTLRVEAGNAGAALHALGITSAVAGGQLMLEARPQIKADNPTGSVRDMMGTIVLSNFETRNAPVLAKLLNALSLSGLRDLLNNNGLSFKKARARFAWIDRGQPHQMANQRLLRIADGQTSGASLGLTFEGDIDLWREVYDLNGTIVPVSDLNNLLEKIPLLGDVLTAGGEGIFAATYKITGPQKDPEVSVNPLSVLAPGILRKIFFED